MRTLLYATAATLLLTLPSGTAQSQPAYAVAFHASTPAPNGGFGYRIEGLEDVDGDGRGDFAVAEWSTSIVHVYSGATARRLHSIVFSQPPSLTAVPDFDGDGGGDLLISARLYSGATGELLHTYAPAGLTTPGASTVVPDADGDGHFDVAIAEAATAADRAVYLVSGASGDLLHVFNNPSPTPFCDSFGVTLAGLADVDGDGRGDLAVADPDAECGEGRLHVFSGASGALIRTLGPHETYDLPHGFGTGLDAFTDIDGDGRGDLLITGPATNWHSGRAYVFSGGTGERLLFIGNPWVDYDFYGASVAVLPDMTGDGLEDFIVGAPGLIGDPEITGDAYLYDASGDRLAHLTSSFPENNGGFGRPLSGVPDIDGDGLGEILVSARLEDVQGHQDAGCVYLFLSMEPALPLVEVEPVDPPIVIPDEGGTFTFTVALDSQSDIFQSWDVWGQAFRNGSEVGEQLGPNNVWLDPGQDSTFVLEQEVPGTAPPGDYTYTVYVGRYPDPVAGAFSFPFSKAQPTASEPVPDSAVLTLSASPNPAPRRATLTLTLPAPGPARLALFDALGREVAVLAEGERGAGPHEVTLDASRLAPGVYVARLTAGEASVKRRLVIAR